MPDEFTNFMQQSWYPTIKKLEDRLTSLEDMANPRAEIEKIERLTKANKQELIALKEWLKEEIETPPSKTWNFLKWHVTLDRNE